MRCSSHLPVTLCSLVTVAGLGGSAAAGPYLGLGIGTSPTLGEGMRELTPTSRSGRLELGQRLGGLAIEGGVGGFRLAATAQEVDVISLSGGAKGFLTLDGPLDAFARGGVERTWLRADGDMADYQGDGYYLGAGLELRLALPLGATSIWLDYTQHQATLHAQASELDSSVGMWTFGVSVGI